MSSTNRNNDHRMNDSRSLVMVVLDVSPLAWGERDLKRTAQDKSRLAAGKRSAGPAVLEEVLDAVQAFGNAVVSIEREAALVILAVADNETAVVYPRKDVMAEWLLHPDSYLPDNTKMREDLICGVAELVSRAAKKAENQSNAFSRQGAMAAGFARALCCINRILLAAHAGGVSALRNEHYLNRIDDDGVVALMGSNGNNKNRRTGNRTPSAWSPRILLIQASEDRSRDYNAFMNCTFACMKQKLVVDGCFLLSGNNQKTSSAFLEQTCDLTGGVFLPPSAAAQVGGALTEIFLSVFLSPIPCRSQLHLPALNKVDFRARCFESGEIVDMAFVCNQCLSIFRKKQTTGFCPTCQARIFNEAAAGSKRRKEN